MLLTGSSEDLGARPLPFADTRIGAAAILLVLLDTLPAVEAPLPRVLGAVVEGPADAPDAAVLPLFVLITVTSGSRARLVALVLALAAVARAVEATVVSLESESEVGSEGGSGISLRPPLALVPFMPVFIRCVREIPRLLLPNIGTRLLRLLLLISLWTGRGTRRAELVTTGASSAELSSVAEVDTSLCLELVFALLSEALLRDVEAAGAPPDALDPPKPHDKSAFHCLERNTKLDIPWPENR